MPDRIRLNDDNRKWWTLAAMCFALFMIMLDNTIVNVALPSIQRALHTTAETLQWTIDAYVLAFGGVHVCTASAQLRYLSAGIRDRGRQRPRRVLFSRIAIGR